MLAPASKTISVRFFSQKEELKSLGGGYAI
jgi:hypothetical protein